MGKIFAPNKAYSGISAGVHFFMGVGETSNPHLIEWFKSKGYGVELDDERLDFEKMTVEELKAYAEENGIDIGKATSKDGVIRKLDVNKEV